MKEYIGGRNRETRHAVLDNGRDETMDHVVLVCERYEQQRGKMKDVVRLEVGA